MSSKILDLLDEEFILIESKKLINLLSYIDLTYNYLENFVAFVKNIDEEFSIAAITKDHSYYYAIQDILRCLEKRQPKIIPGDESLKNYIIYFIDYKFKLEYDCPHGKEYKDVYILFFLDDEDQIIKYLMRFNKLKGFV